MNTFDPPKRLSRIISVEMFEQLMNWRGLLTRAQGWPAADGRLFLHVFTHRTGGYLFDRDNAKSGSRSISSPAGNAEPSPDSAGR